MDTRPDRAWKTGSASHEGFPLLLRTPCGLDYDVLSRKFPNLLVVRHKLSKVQPSGLPEPDYNDSLADLDHHLINLPEALDRGISVLVETFGGKRNHYYIADESDIDARETLTRLQFPGQALTWDLRDDPEWGFIRRYAKEYGF
jgi:hypothetical protein